MREAMPVEPMQPTSPAVPSRGPLVQPHVRLGLSRPEAAEYSVGVSLFDQTVPDDQHAAAIEMAISVARLPKGTAIILQTEHETISGRIYWSVGRPRPIIRSSRVSMAKRWCSPMIS
jgi:hypothetical protein